MFDPSRYKFIDAEEGVGGPGVRLTVFGKGEKSDVSKAEQNELRKVLKGLVARYIEGVKERTR